MLSACGALDDEYYEDDYTTEEPFVDETGGEPIATGVPGDLVFDFGFDPQVNGFSFENYGDDIGAHPVGTGAFRLKSWRRASRTWSTAADLVPVTPWTAT